MDSRRQHNGMHTPLQQQQFPPLLPQGGGHPPRLPLPLPHPNMGFNPRPSSFSGPLAGQKRNLRFSDGGGFTKLFVASLPRNITEDEVRDLFGGFGNVLEVIFLKDKKTGLPQGCCFVKYASASDAERAIRALDNQRTLPGGPAPLQVKLADGEREHSGPMEHKLFVGSLNRQANEQEIEEIFAPYGCVENVYIIRDERKQSRGCAFVSFPERDMAISAISALNGVYRMKGCHQPIIVRFADPKRPRSGERDASRMGGSGTNFSPRSHHGGPGMSLNLQSQPVIGPPRGSSGPTMESHNSPFGWRQGGGAGGVGLLPQTGILPLGSSGSTPAPKGPLEGSNTVQGLRGNNLSNQVAPGVSDQSSVTGMASQIPQQQGFKDPPLQKASGQMYGPLQHSGAQQSVPGSTTQHNQLQPLQGYPPSQSTEARLQQPQPQQASIAQYAPSQPSSQGHIYGQPSAPSQPLQPQIPSSLQQPNSGPSSQTLQQTITGLSSQPLQQPITGLSSQPMQQPLQGLSSQPQQQPLTGLSTQPSQHSLTGLSSQPLQQAITGLSSQAPHQPITGLSSQPLQQPVAGMASQPLQQLSSQPLQYQPLRPQESQPNLQTATSQAIQQAQQFLSLQPIQPQMNKESTQQGYLQPLQSTAQANQQPISAQVSWSIPLQQQLLHQSQQSQSVVSQPQTHISQQQAMPLQHQAVPVQQQATPAVATVTPSPMPTPTVATCDWTEHTSPEGHKYYYNSKTGESRWEKPEEFAAFERQQQQQQLLASQQQQPQQQAQQQQPQQQPQQQLHQQPQQLLQLQQLQGGQAQLQAQLQHMQPQQLNPQYQQQQFQQQVQLVQPFQQQSQAQVQQGQQPSQLPQPQLQQLPQNQQLQQQVQLQQLQHPASQVQQQQQQQQQQQREVQYNGQGMLLQVPSSGSFQAVQGYMQLQPGSQSLSGLGDASRTAAVQQQLSSNQQIPAANGLADTARVAQWTPALQQGVVSQDWMWKTKPAGS